MVISYTILNFYIYTHISYFLGLKPIYFHKYFKHVAGLKHQYEYVNDNFEYLLIIHPHVFSCAIVNTSLASTVSSLKIITQTIAIHMHFQTPFCLLFNSVR